MEVFKEYMCPKIIKQLDINFTEKELKEQIKLKLKHNLLLAAKEYKVTDCEEYKSENSIQCQISKKYGPGTHFLIPNLKNIGVGKSKSIKKKIGVRFCTIEEYKKNKFSIEDIDISKLLEHLKRFYKNSKDNSQTKL
jgi:hypothetical protein